jgi:phosphoglycerate dehydrogenase-like enzyme
MKVLAFSPHADRAQAAALGVRLVSLEELLTTSDFVSLHARLTAENHGLLGPKQLAQMKPTAYLINVARGELVDQSALVAALRDHWIAGAGLDVYEHEPLSLDDPLLTLDNVILTPHWSASTTDVFTATSRAMTAGMLLAARGLAPDNVVNPAVLTRPKFQAKLARFAQNKAGCGKRV